MSSPTIGAAEKDSRPGLIILLVALGLIIAALRLAAARGELWFDEVWTIQGVQAAVHSPTDIVLRVKHDNNHFLNSLVVYWIGPDGTAWMYRLPAVIFGTLTVLLAVLIARRHGWAAMLAGVILTGCSYLLVNYSSEARGYAYEMFFALAAFGSLCAAEASANVNWEILFSASCILGFLAHPLFLTVYLSAQVYTWIPFGHRQQEGKRLPSVAAIICRTIIPGLFFGWLYWINLSQLTIGSGESPPVLSVIVQTLSLAVGGPFDPPGSYAAAAVTLLSRWRR
ncbi:MAG TPA: hypothetical protein VFE46_17390 [Pirellulales bacterium]|jgi:uncharacterized membrane protein|nr:hypothetical protein [Pirellulales bacterium]